MCFNLPLKAMMVMMLEWCGAKGIRMSFTKFQPLSPNMHVAHTSGHCMVICKCEIIVFLTYIDLTKKIPSNILEHGMGLIMVVSKQCL